MHAEILHPVAPQQRWFLFTVTVTSVSIITTDQWLQKSNKNPRSVGLHEMVVKPPQ